MLRDSADQFTLWFRAEQARSAWWNRLVRLFRQRVLPNHGVRVRARLAYPIGMATLAIGDGPNDFQGLHARKVAAPGLCIEVFNGSEDVITITEVGLTKGVEGAQIALREPLLHDNGPWPRRLAPGQAVIAHFGSMLAGHRILGEVRRSYAVTMDGRHYLGPAHALRHYRNLMGGNRAA